MDTSSSHTLELCTHMLAHSIKWMTDNNGNVKQKYVGTYTRVDFLSDWSGLTLVLCFFCVSLWLDPLVG